MSETNGKTAEKPHIDERKWREFLEVVGNQTLTSRMAFQQLFDKRRDIDAECGYPDMGDPVPVETFRQLFDRDAIGARVIELLPKECWQVTPALVETEDTEELTDFERAVDELQSEMVGGSSFYAGEEGSTIWEHLFRADILSGIGQFGVILLGLDDGKNLQDPVEGVMTVNSKLTPVLDAAGRQVGARAVPIKSKLAPDGPVTNAQKEALLDDDKWVKRVWDAKQGAYETVKGVPLNDHEKQIVKNWDTYTQTDSSSAAQYSSGLGTGMPPAGVQAGSLAGTDQQYFGVQFGPSQALPKEPVKAGTNKLLFVRCFDESLVQIVRYEWNIRNSRFGLPVMYRVTLNDPREVHSGVGLPLATVFVHWSRVVHIADNLRSSEIFGCPRMRQVLNNVLGLRKLYGASPEGYWKSCFTKLSLETHPQLGGEVSIDRPGLQQMMFDFTNNLQPWAALTGMSMKSIAPTVVDPGPHIDKQIEAICILLGCPVRVFKGSERGELASGQDDSSWNDRLRHRQNMHVTPHIIVAFFDRLIMLGVLPEPEEGYTVKWPDLDSLSDKDKAAIFLQRTQAYAAYVTGDVEQVLPPKYFMTEFDGMDEDIAEEILDEAEKSQEDHMTSAPNPNEPPPAPPQIPGIPAIKPPLGAKGGVSPTPSAKVPIPKPGAPVAAPKA